MSWLGSNIFNGKIYVIHFSFSTITGDPQEPDMNLRTHNWKTNTSFEIFTDERNQTKEILF